MRAPHPALRVTPQVLCDELHVVCEESHVVCIDADDRVERFHVVEPLDAHLCVEPQVLWVDADVVFVEEE